MKKILFSDLDGTLLKRIWVKRKDRLAIQREMKNGLLFIISTGRDLKSFKKFLFIQKIKFDYAILGNGSQIIDSKKKIINEVTFETYELLEVLQFILKTIALKTEIEVTVTDNYKTKIFNNYQMDDKGTLNKEFPNTISHCCVAVKNKKIFEEFIEQLIQDINFLNIEMNGRYIDITAKNINKAYGVSKIIEYVDITPIRTYAIGDSYNDISMLKAVDFGFAISSGTKEIRDIADIEVSSIKECIEVIKLQEYKNIEE